MTQWGLTAELREQRPWGLDEAMLAPGKVVTDPIHHDIHLSRLEVALLNSKPLQRLRRVRQLGTANLVYPGATHSRLSHSLGALHVSQRILDVVEAQRSGPHPTRDLFEEWAASGDRTFPYEKRLAESIVLGRLGGLLHDLCHIPFGHTLEDDLELLAPHDENEERFERLWTQFPEDIRAPMEAGGLLDALKPLILSKADPFSEDTYEELPPFADRPPELRYPFIRDVVGNTICADLIDYLQRDHYMTGLPASLGHRFLDGFYVAPSGSWSAERMVMRIARGDRERADIVTELFKYLRYRYEETERVLVHHTKLGADAMIGKLLAMWSDELLIEELRGAGVIEGRDIERDIDAVTSHVGDVEVLHVARVRVARQLEDLFLERGDDGVLEHIASEYRDPVNSRQEAIRDLTVSVLDRSIFKLIGKAPQTAGLDREKFFNTFGNPAKKREIERRVARFAGLTEGWHLLLWIPHPKMRLKPADVLVTSDGRTIQPLRLHDRHGQQGEAISESHRELWAVSVYASSSVAADPELRSAILAELSKEMGGLRWEGQAAQHEDAEASIGASIGASHRLPQDEERHIVDSLRLRRVAALTRRGDGAPGSPGDRTYANLREQALAITEAGSAERLGLGVVDPEVDDVQDGRSSLFPADREGE